MLQDGLGSIIRWLLTLLAMRLVDIGIWTGDQAKLYVTGLTLALLTLGWSLWQKYRTRILILVGLMMPTGATENDVKAIIKSGAVTPTVTTPSNTAPGVPLPTGPDLTVVVTVPDMRQDDHG